MTRPPGSTVVDVGIDLLKFSAKVFQLKNTGAQPLTQAKVQATNIDASIRQASDWEDIDTSTFGTLASGATKSLLVNLDSRRYWRIQCASTSGTTIVAALAAGG